MAYGDDYFYLVGSYNLRKFGFDFNELASFRYFDNLLSIIAGHAPESCDMRGVCSPNTVIEADGSIFPCDFYVLDRWKVGNINKNEIIDTYKNPIMSEFINVSQQPNQKCLACSYYNICRGGCRRHKEPIINDQMQHNYFCQSFTMFFDKRLNELIEILKYVQRNPLRF